MACDNQELWAAINRASAEREVLMEAVAMLKVKVAALEAAAKSAEGHTGYPFAPYAEWYPPKAIAFGSNPTMTSNTGQTVHISN